MRICIYTETALPKMGGQEMVVDALARQYQALGHQVTVMAPQPRLPMRARDHELPYAVSRHVRFFSTRHGVSLYRWWLLRLRRKFPFDVLHCHGVYPPGYLAALCRARLGVPTVITSHGGDVREGNVRLAKPVVRKRQEMALRQADALVAISNFTEQGYLRLGADASKIIHIPNGVDIGPLTSLTTRPAGLDCEIQPKKYFLFLGRLKERKGVDLLLRALHLTQFRNRVDLVIAGSGEEFDSLQNLSRELNLRDRVRFVGAAHGEMKSYLLQNALAVVMPSRVWEAFPLVVLESFAAGTPVVATRVPGLEDKVQAGETGWLVDAESPQSLATALNEVLSQPNECERMGGNAARNAATYSWRNIAERHIELYTRLVGNNQLRWKAG